MQTRSTQKELIDLGPDFYTPEEYTQCMQKLFRVNRLLGFFRSTRKALKDVPADAKLLDIGCGDGLFLLHLSRHYPRMNLQGTDVSTQAIASAEQMLKQWQAHNKALRVSFVPQPRLRLELPGDSVDVILTTLVCHHLDDDDLVVFLRDAYQAARIKVIINDLHRHSAAYWLYYCISPWLFRNRLITHDGLISIQRSFRRAEWHKLLARAGIKHAQIKWQFPFRWSVILWKN